jgi:hypothetical protein
MYEPLTAEDFVIYKENGEIMSGGYKVDSILLNQNSSPILTEKSNGQHIGGNVSSSLFSDLAIPGGLLFSTNTNKNTKYDVQCTELIEDGLFEKMLKMLDPTFKKTHNLKTKKIKTKHKTTRKIK